MSIRKIEMDNCKEIIEKLSALLDGELEGDDLKEVEEHIASCDACSAELEQMRKVDRFTALAEPPHISDAEWDVSWADISTRLSIARRPISIWKIAAPLSVAAAVLIAVVLIFVIASSPPAEIEAEGPDMAIHEVADGYSAYMVGGAEGPNTIVIIVPPDSEDS